MDIPSQNGTPRIGDHHVLGRSAHPGNVAKRESSGVDLNLRNVRRPVDAAKGIVFMAGSGKATAFSIKGYFALSERLAHVEGLAAATGEAGVLYLEGLGVVDREQRTSAGPKPEGAVMQSMGGIDQRARVDPDAVAAGIFKDSPL